MPLRQITRQPEIPTQPVPGGLRQITGQGQWGVEEEEHGMLGELGAGLGRGVLRVVGTPANLADIAGEAIGWKGLEKAGEAGAEAIEQYIQESPRLRKSASISGDIRDNPQLWTDPRWYLSLIGEGAPTIASMIIPGMAAAKAAKVAGWGAKGIMAARTGGALTAGMGLEAGGAAEDVRQYEERTGTQVPIGKKLKTVVGTGVVAGSLEAVPVFNLFGGTVARKLIGRIITSMAFEGGTEGAQEIVANAFAKAGYDADRDMVGGVIESVIGGVLLGGGMGAMQQTFQERIKETDSNKVADLLEQAEKETAEKPDIIAMIDEGMTTGKINGEPFTPEIATGIIQEAYADKALTDEDLDNFREKYPDLRPVVNDIIGENVKDKINAEMEAVERAKIEAEEAYQKTPEYRQKLIEAEMPVPTEPTADVARELVGVEKKAVAGEKVEKEAVSDIDNLIESFEATGHVATRYPQKRQISVDGRTMNEKEAIAKMRRVVEARPPKPPKAKLPEAVTEPIKAEVIPEPRPKIEKEYYVPELDKVFKESEFTKVKTPMGTTWGLKELPDKAVAHISKESLAKPSPAIKPEVYEKARKAFGIEEKAEVTPEKKEPWEMGENEYVQSRLEDLKGKIKLTGQARNLYLMEWKDKFTVTHQRSVEKAIQEDKLPKPKKEKVEIETTPEGKEISVDLTKKEEVAVTPKQQKEYLLAEIDKAIEDYNKLIESGESLTEDQGFYTFEVPNDGTFGIAGTFLPEFQSRVKSAFPSTIISKKFKPKAEARKAIPTAKYNKIIVVPPKDLKPADIDRIFKEVADTEARDITGAVLLNPFQNWLLSQDITKAVKDKIRSVAGKDYIDEARTKIEKQDLGYAKDMVEYRQETMAEIQDYYDSYKEKTLTLKQIEKETGVKRSSHDLRNELQNAKYAHAEAVRHLEKLEKPTGVKAPEGKVFATKGTTLKQLKPDEKTAIENTEGAILDNKGLSLDVVRYQKPEQAGELSIREGVFFLPEKKSPYKKYYTTGKIGYGGSEKLEGRTTYRNPYMVKAASGGRAPKLAYDFINGKGAYEKMRSEVLKKAWGKGFNRLPDYSNIDNLLKKYGGNPDLTDAIIEVSKEGNTLPYAIQEHIVAASVRKAGYDAVIGYTKIGGKIRLSEVFDVRPARYPSKITWEHYFEDFYGQKKPKPTTSVYATKATKPQDTITRADLKSIFAKMKNISTGVDKDGNFFFRPFGKPVVTIYTVDEIKGYIDTSKGQIPVGSFLGNTIELKTGGKGHTADIGTAFHEFCHFLEKNNILSGNDIKALNGVIAKSEGISENKVTEEHRATYVGDRLSEWQGQKNLRIRRVLKKIADFVNSIWELVSRTRTARGVLADIESGAIPQNQWIITEGKGTSFSVEAGKQFATKPTPDYKEMLKRYQKAHTTPLVDELIEKTQADFDPVNATPEETRAFLRDVRKNLIPKRFRSEVLSIRDMKWYHKALETPYVLAKKFVSMKAAVKTEINRHESRTKKMFGYYHGDLADLQKHMQKNKEDLKTFESLIWEWENERFPEKEVPTDWYSVIEDIKDDNYGGIRINPEHYTEVRAYLKKQGVKDVVADGFVAVRKILDDVLIEADATMRGNNIDQSDLKEFRSYIGKAHNYFSHVREGNSYIKITNRNTKKTVYREHFWALKERALPERKMARTRTEAWLKNQLASREPGTLTGKRSDYFVSPAQKVTKLPDEVFFQIPVEALSQISMEAGKGLSASRVHYEALRLMKKEGLSEKEAHEKAGNILTADMGRILAKAMADVLKTRGWGQHAIQRQNIPGFKKTDVFETLSGYLTGYAGFATKIQAAKEHSKTLRDIDARKTPVAYKYTSEYVRDMLANADRTDQMVDRLRGLFFVKYLGGVVKSGIVNLTQNAVMAGPILSQYTKFSHIKLARAMVDVRKGITGKNAWMGKETSYAILPKNEQKALIEGIETGVAQDLYLRELKGEIPGKGWGKYVKKVIDKSGIFMMIAEKFNRASTLLAAYRVGFNEGLLFEGKQTKGNHGLSVQFAKGVVYDSHFLYGKPNLPVGFRGGDFRKIARAAYTFRSFTHNYLDIMVDLMANQGTQGFKVAGRSLMNLMVVGGLTSIPFFKALSEVIKWASDDEDEDLLTEIRGTMSNKFMQDVLVYGLVGASGGFDLSGSLSIEVPRNFKDIVGVPYSIYEDSMNMVKSIKAGNAYRAVSETPFTPIVMRNAMRGIELYTKGQRTRGGKAINVPGKREPRKITGAEAIRKSILGLQPTEVSSGYKAYRAATKMKGAIADKKRDWADKIANATIARDFKKVREIKAEIRAWNLNAKKDKKLWRVINIDEMVKNRLQGKGLKGFPKSMRREALIRYKTWM